MIYLSRMDQPARFPRLLGSLLLVALAQVPGKGQELRTNAAGEKIIVETNEITYVKRADS